MHWSGTRDLLIFETQPRQSVDKVVPLSVGNIMMLEELLASDDVEPIEAPKPPTLLPLLRLGLGGGLRDLPSLGPNGDEGGAAVGRDEDTQGNSGE